MLVLMRFLAKRMLGLLFVAGAVSFSVDGFRFALPLGLLLGGFLALGKVRLNTWALSAVAAGGSPSKSGAAQLVSLLLVLGLLAASVFANVRLFIGIAAGLLLLPLFICANALTERLGLTHNFFGGATDADYKGRKPWNMQ